MCAWDNLLSSLAPGRTASRLHNFGMKRQANGSAKKATACGSAFQLTSLVVRVSLPAACLGNVRAGVDCVLASYLMKYREDINGVMLSFSDVELAQGSARVGDMAMMHFDVRAQALVFRPAVGMLLQGVVAKVAGDHIGLLVSGVFNASISGDTLTEGYVFDGSRDCWVASDGGTLEEGTPVRFEVERLHEAAGLVSITGSLPSASRVAQLEARAALDIKETAEMAAGATPAQQAAAETPSRREEKEKKKSAKKKKKKRKTEA